MISLKLIVAVLSALVVSSCAALETQAGEGPPDDLEPLEFNRGQLVEQAVAGEIRQPFQSSPPYRVSPEGDVKSLPGTGSITYNYRVGDSAVDMAGDHVEPSVSISHPDSDHERALNVMSSIGNTVRVTSGDAKGSEGTVIGKHGGIENVMVEFDDEVYDELVIGDQMQLRVVGMGMEPENAEGLGLRNMAPELVDALNENGMGLDDEGTLHVPVTHTIPAKIMGSGLGQSHVESGDYDIQLFDEEVNEEYNLDELRFGDIVAITDADHLHGRIYRSGAVSIGVVVHGISRVAGHGPGVTTLITSPDGDIQPYLEADANLKNLLDLR